jgi:hypothetical protein
MSSQVESIYFPIPIVIYSVFLLQILKVLQSLKDLHFPLVLSPNKEGKARIMDA